jgi:hypothetical protein
LVVVVVMAKFHTPIHRHPHYVHLSALRSCWPLRMSS